MQIIPVQDTPSQNFNINLAGQQTQISLYTRDTGLYCDVSVNNSLVIGGVICEDRARIVQNSYLGFQGDLVWIDNMGSESPSVPGIGTRYIFYYLTVDDVNSLTNG